MKHFRFIEDNFKNRLRLGVFAFLILSIFNICFTYNTNNPRATHKSLGAGDSGEDLIGYGGDCLVRDDSCQLTVINFTDINVARDEFVSVEMQGSNCDDQRINFSLYQGQNIIHSFEQNFGDFLYPLLMHVDETDFSTASSEFYFEVAPTNNICDSKLSNTITVRNEESNHVKIQFPVYSVRGMDVYHLDGSKTSYDDSEIDDIISFMDDNLDLSLHGKLYDDSDQKYLLKDYSDKPSIIYRSARTFPDYYELGYTSHLFYNETLERSTHEDWFVHSDGLESHFNTRLVRSCTAGVAYRMLEDSVSDWGDFFSSWTQYYMKEDSLWDGVFYDNSGGVISLHREHGYHVIDESAFVGSDGISISLDNELYLANDCEIITIVTESDPETVLEYSSAEDNTITLTNSLPQNTDVLVTYYGIGTVPQNNYDTQSSKIEYMLSQTREQLGSRLMVYNGAIPDWADAQAEFHNYVDGAMHEGVFHAPWYGMDRVLDKDDWLEHLENMKLIVDRGSMFLDQSGIDTVNYGGATEEQVQQMAMYTFSSFLLAKNERSYFHFNVRPGSFQKFKYFDYWDTDIGDDLGDYYIYGNFDGAEVFARDFENVLVLVNPDETSATINLEDDYQELNGEIISQLTMPAKTGAILLRYVESPEPLPVSCSDNIKNGNETGIDCGGSCASCDDGNGEVVTPPPSRVCGNHIVESGEQCDDGNIINDDGCSYLCQTEEGQQATYTSTILDILKPQGVLVKTGNDPRVHYVNEDNERYYIPNLATFHSWFDNFESLQVIDSLTLNNNYPYQGRLTVRPGNLVKFDESNKVYVIEPEKTLRWVTTGDIFQEFGYNFNKIIHLPAEDFDYYSLGETLSSSDNHPTGQILKHGDYPQVFYIDDGTEYWIKDETTFLSLGLKWQDIITIPVRYWYNRVMDGLSFRLKDW
ncbi:hypothetical protein HN670_00585 [bacterium]|mgnify:CR=1 FL=1|jgi:cysteine-rich repeat protein|nr:hypothetical protein [bacterium]